MIVLYIVLYHNKSYNISYIICVVLYLIVSYRIVLCCIVLSCILTYHIISYRIVLYLIVSYRIASVYCVVLYLIVSYRIALYCIVSYRIISYHIVLYCILSPVLYRIILCCIVLYRTLTAVSATTHVTYTVHVITRYMHFVILILFHNLQVKKAFNRKKQVWSESHDLFQSHSQTPAHAKRYETTENSGHTISTSQVSMVNADKSYT